ncbi:hypothetical protein ACWOVF_004485 [Vibrio parahaemolyticus]
MNSYKVTIEPSSSIEESSSAANELNLTNREVFVNDVKVFFDSLRNMGLCMLFLIVAAFGGLEQYIANEEHRNIVTGVYIGIGVVLILFNTAWAFFAAANNGKNTAQKLFTIAGLVIVFTIQAFGLFNLKSVVFSELNNQVVCETQ